LSSVIVTGNELEFRLPPQYESRQDDLVFRATLDGGGLAGTTTLDSGVETRWTARRAPDFDRTTASEFGEPIELVRADMSNWKLRSPDWEGHWSIRGGILTNSGVGSDLVSVDVFGDFRLVARYRYPAGSNSGIYLRGRYEFQILDDHGVAPHVGSSGAIYGFLVPSENAIRAHGEWNEVEITLIGRTITVVLNGIAIIEQDEIPGITGGALDSNESEPGPLFLQGDHGPVEFERLTVFPAL
jgi:hypothetical protein